ncbi:MAG: Y4bD/Y4pK family protein, partial [Planctomycetes bacterium]|nr:Y4bD/Y4pK family protein [Planctomycetota bacterium]
FRITHPFHPAVGRDFELVAHKHTWGEHRVYFLDSEGKLRSLPASWTSAVDPDPFLVVSAGRALFRFEDLLRLVDLVGASGAKPTKRRKRGRRRRKMS